MELATNIFNEKGEHKLEHLKKVIRTEVKIDFWEESVKIYVTIPQANRQNKNFENKLIGNVVNGRIRQRSIFKRFKVSEDFSTVTIDDYDWYIPVLFNREALKQQDIKTWEMVFYYIFKQEVNEAIQKAKTMLFLSIQTVQAQAMVVQEQKLNNGEIVQMCVFDNGSYGYCTSEDE